MWLPSLMTAKVFQAQVNPNDVRHRFKRLLVHLARKAGVPPVGASLDRDGLNLTLNWAMQPDFDMADLGQRKHVAFQPHAIAVLRVGQAVVAAVALDRG